MPTLGEFQTIVRGAVRRGNSLDAEIATATKRAVEFIEQNYNLPYMRKVLTDTVTDEFVIDGTDGQTLKSIQIVRWEDSAGAWRRIVQIDPDQLLSTDGDHPSGYEHIISSDTLGVLTHTLEFDAPFTEATEVEVLGFFKTVVNLTNPSDASIWLVNNAEGALLARTMINLAPIMREPQVMQMYNMLWQEEQKVLIGAADALEQGNR
jgi:hypothetical protein